jgi:hypothetical protein
MDISVSPVLLQSSSFETTSGQWLLRFRRKHRLTTVCSFEVVVFITFHVSDPYNNSDFTLVLKMRSLVPVDTHPTGIHKFSKNLGATSKFQVPGGRHEASYTLKTPKY